MPIATRTFRVFVSSTFEDLRAERNALQERVFPEMVKFCAGKGARFQAIDLRWGVREEAGLDQRTMEICLAEIARCQKTGIKPNFIVLLADRYGQIPLPSRIKKDEFEALLAHVLPDERKLLLFDEAQPAADNGWYRLDRNANPPEYLLKSRDGEYKERSRWVPVKTRMRDALRNAARAARLPEVDLVKYEASATHQEVLAGLGTEAKDREHVFAFLRNPDTPKDPEVNGLIETLRRELPEANRVPFSEGDLDGLCKEVTERLKKVIEVEAVRFQSQSALEQEKEAHGIFARECCKQFVGRAAVLEEIRAYLGGNEMRPLVLHGPSGCGKSAIIAKASEERLGIRRFIGVTPESSNGVTLLRSLCEEIGERFGQAGDLPATFNELTVLFRDQLRLATADRSLILFIDALDQVGEQDPAAMSWLPPELPPHCRLVVSTINVPPSLAIANTKLVRVEPFSVKEADETLDLWLKDAKQTLQTDQRENLLEGFRQTGLPLYLKLAFEEARLWRSFDPVDKRVLGNGLSGIIDQLFTRLSEPGNHGEVLVRQALGYLNAARYGLTEDEMLGVLAADDQVWADFERAKKHDLPQYMYEAEKGNRQLPVIVWSRLHLDLEPYLTERSVPGGTVISFYHRQLAERTAEDKSHHAELARYFSRQPNWRGEQSNQRKITELVHQQVGAGLGEGAESTLTDLDFVSAKCAAELVFDLQQDYRVTTALTDTIAVEQQSRICPPGMPPESCGGPHFLDKKDPLP